MRRASILILALCIISVAIVCSVVYVTYKYVPHWLGLAEATTAAELGDQFGLANTVFSGLAFAAVFAALLLQTRELGYQREDLDQARDIMHEQSRAMRRQAFESTFFNLLGLIEDRRSMSRFSSIGFSISRSGEVVVDSRGRECRGIEAFDAAVASFRSFHSKAIESLNSNECDPFDVFAIFFREYMNDKMSQYFRLLEDSIVFIKFSQPRHGTPSRQDVFYARTVRSHLSPSELWLFYYYIKSSLSDGQVDDYAKYMNVFKYLDTGTLVGAVNSDMKERG